MGGMEIRERIHILGFEKQHVYVTELLLLLCSFFVFVVKTYASVIVIFIVAFIYYLSFWEAFTCIYNYSGYYIAGPSPCNLHCLNSISPSFSMSIFAVSYY